MEVTLIGDIHGHKEIHARLMNGSERTIQLGDCGFEYGYLTDHDPDLHKVLPGNHDNYDWIPQFPHFLGDFGVLWDKIGFVRGAWSIDKAYRTPGKDWWPEEELTLAACDKAVAFFEALPIEQMPRIMISHEAPASVFKKIHEDRNYIPNQTGNLLAHLFTIVRPDLWVFGHHHVSRSFRMNGTHFVCLREFEPLILEI